METETITTPELDLEDTLTFLRLLGWSGDTIVAAIAATQQYLTYQLGAVIVLPRARGTEIVRFVQIKGVKNV